MKKNLVMRIAAVVLMCTLVTACFASSTFAKYTSQATGTDTARVAKWEIVQGTGDKEVAITGSNPVVKVDLFKTVLDTKNDATETDVKSSTSTAIIAPGTKGEFAIDEIYNKSEVTANIVIKIKSITNAAEIPVVLYKADGSELEAGDEIANEDVAIGAKLDAQTVTWEWVFENGADAFDTSLGIKGTDTITVELEIIATQVD